ASSASGCRANRATPSCSTAAPTAYRCRNRSAKVSTRWRANSISRCSIRSEERSMVSQSSVGLVGFGLMGEVYATRLLAAGFAVEAYDVDAAKAERMAQIGVRAA